MAQHTPTKNILDILRRDLNLSTPGTEVLFMLHETLSGNERDICLPEKCMVYSFDEVVLW